VLKIKLMRFLFAVMAGFILCINANAHKIVSDYVPDNDLCPVDQSCPELKHILIFVGSKGSDNKAISEDVEHIFTEIIEDWSRRTGKKYLISNPMSSVEKGDPEVDVSVSILLRDGGKGFAAASALIYVVDKPWAEYGAFSYPKILSVGGDGGLVDIKKFIECEFVSRLFYEQFRVFLKQIGESHNSYCY